MRTGTVTTEYNIRRYVEADHSALIRLRAVDPTLTFLGTAAAQGYPDPFCSCAHCDRARALGGPSLRKRASALIGDDLLIDIGPDLIAASMDLRIPLSRLRYCLQTHAHSDHLDPAHFLIRSREYGVPEAPRLHYYASPEVLARASTTFVRDLSGDTLEGEAEERNLTLHAVAPFAAIELGPYRAIPFPANHGPGALLWAVTAGARTIFYAVDTSVLPEETWRGFHRLSVKFDIVVLDHTYGFVAAPLGDHLTAHQVVAHMQRMREEGLLADGARVFGTHLEHETNPPHPEIAALAAQHGYEIAYDGLRV